MQFQKIKTTSYIIYLSFCFILISCSKNEPVNTKLYALKQEFSVYENSPVGQFVGIAHAYVNNQQDTLLYSITSGNDSNAFSIDALTGIITVNNSRVLDYETHPKFVLGISAVSSNNIHNFDTTIVYIDLINTGIPTNGLVSYYMFANNLVDYISSKTGTGKNIAFFYDRRGWYKESIEFLGFKSYAILDSIYDFPSRTISFWFKALNINEQLQIMYSSNDSSLLYGQTVFSVRKTDTTNYLLINVGDISDSTAIYQDIWYQTAVAINANKATFYLNGQSFGQQVMGSFLHSNFGASKATLGVDCSLTRNYYQGLMDNLLIYNRSLNDLEARTIYFEDDLMY